MENFNTPNNSSSKPKDEQNGPKSYQIHLLVRIDEEEVYSALALNLPRAGSCGDTELQATENAREAIRGVIESHVDSGESIPWKDTSSEQISSGAKQEWIVGG